MGRDNRVSIFLHFCLLYPDRHRCSYMRGMCKEKNRTPSRLEAEKIVFPPKTDRRTNTSNFRVASLLKIESNYAYNSDLYYSYIGIFGEEKQFLTFRK